MWERAFMWERALPAIALWERALPAMLIRGADDHRGPGPLPQSLTGII